MKERLKHRLLGAAILLALGVLLLPGFFRDKDTYQVDTDSQIPTRPSVTAVDFDGPTPVDSVEPAPAPETMFLPPGDTESASESTVVSSSANAPATSTDAWVIQVASLGQKEAAEKLLKDLQMEGHKAYLRTVVTDKGSMHRLFIGPKMDRKDAEIEKAAIDKRWNVQSRIYPYKP